MVLGTTRGFHTGRVFGWRFYYVEQQFDRLALPSFDGICGGACFHRGVERLYAALEEALSRDILSRGLELVVSLYVRERIHHQLRW